jgi:hypothetical protein
MKWKIKCLYLHLNHYFNNNQQMRTTTKNVYQEDQSLNWDLNPVLPKYKELVLTIQPQCLVESLKSKQVYILIILQAVTLLTDKDQCQVLCTKMWLLIVAKGSEKMYHTTHSYDNTEPCPEIHCLDCNYFKRFQCTFPKPSYKMGMSNYLH